MGHDFEDGLQIFGAVVKPLAGGLGLDRKYFNNVESVCLLTFGIDVQFYTAAKAQHEGVCRQCAHSILAAGIHCGSVLCLDAAEAALGVKCGEAVEPCGAVEQFAIKVQCAGPNVGAAGIGHIDGGQSQDTVALLGQRHSTGKGTAAHRAGVISVVDFCRAVGLRTVGALHPGRHVEGSHVGVCTFRYGDVCVACLTHDDVLSGIGCGDCASVGNLGTSGHGVWRRSHCDALQLSEEETGVGRLVVANALPNHRVAILMIVPQRRDAVIGGVSCRVNAYRRVVAAADNNLLTPVTEDVGQCAGIVL